MAYRECRRFCKVCGRQTVHWRPGTAWREGEPPDGLSTVFTAVFRVLKYQFKSHQWRCLDCDHPWNTSLLK
jgi:hypothetical protein